MKRSDMIKAMCTPFNDDVVNLHLFEVEAEAILKRIEELGMIPSSCEFKMGDMMVRDNCWESE